MTVDDFGFGEERDDFGDFSVAPAPASLAPVATSVSNSVQMAVRPLAHKRFAYSIERCKVCYTGHTASIRHKRICTPYCWRSHLEQSKLFAWYKHFVTPPSVCSSFASVWAQAA